MPTRRSAYSPSPRTKGAPAPPPQSAAADSSRICPSVPSVSSRIRATACSDPGPSMHVVRVLGSQGTDIAPVTPTTACQGTSRPPLAPTSAAFALTWQSLAAGIRRTANEHGKGLSVRRHYSLLLKLLVVLDLTLLSALVVSPFAAETGRAGGAGQEASCEVTVDAVLASRRAGRKPRRVHGLVSRRSTRSTRDARALGPGPSGASPKQSPVGKGRPGPVPHARNGPTPSSCPQSRPFGCPVPFAISRS